MCIFVGWVGLLFIFPFSQLEFPLLQLMNVVYVLFLAAELWEEPGFNFFILTSIQWKARIPSNYLLPAQLIFQHSMQVRVFTKTFSKLILFKEKLLFSLYERLSQKKIWFEECFNQILLTRTVDTAHFAMRAWKKNLLLSRKRPCLQCQDFQYFLNCFGHQLHIFIFAHFKEV